MTSTSTKSSEQRHWFYDSWVLVSAFCLISFMIICWQVNRFEGFQSIFTCESDGEIDQTLLSSGMEACMGKAHTPEDQAGCIRTVYILACMKEQWR